MPQYITQNSRTTYQKDRKAPKSTENEPKRRRKVAGKYVARMETMQECVGTMWLRLGIMQKCVGMMWGYI